MLRKVLREVSLLRKLTEINNNIYTTQVKAVMLPQKCYMDSPEGSDEKKQIINVDELTHLFIVMDLSDFSLKNLLDSSQELEEDHIVSIIYNILSAINFLHSANLIHRDLKPANILLDDNCQVKICDFGISRCMPKRSNFYK